MQEWLISVAGKLSIRQMEIEIGCGLGTLQKVVDGKRNLPKKWEEPLMKYKESICVGAK